MIEELEKLGLTNREAHAYRALVFLGEANANGVAKKAKEHRVNVYDSLDKLVKKGLVSYVVRNNVKYFRIVDPKKLVSFVEDKKYLAEKLCDEIMASRVVKEKKPIVEVYEGSEGFKTILMKMLKEGKTIYGIGASEEWEKRFPIKVEQYMKERKKRKIHAKLLYVKGVKPIKSKMNQIRYLSVEFSQPSTIGIFGDYVAVFMWTDPLIATLTKCKQLSDSFRNYFGVLWKVSNNV